MMRWLFLGATTAFWLAVAALGLLAALRPDGPGPAAAGSAAPAVQHAASQPATAEPSVPSAAGGPPVADASPGDAASPAPPGAAAAQAPAATPGTAAGLGSVASAGATEPAPSAADASRAPVAAQPKPTPAQPDTRPALTLAEVARHARPDDCWMVIDGVAYDFTAYLPRHPTRLDVIAPSCGTDATEAYRTKNAGRPHSRYADGLLPDYRLGPLVP